MNDKSFSKDGPAINEYHYHITKKQYSEEAHNIYNADKPIHIILEIIGIHMDMITIKSNM